MASSQQCLEEYLPKVSELKHSDPIDLCGDGRADSPGHNAKYGTYTLMEESTGKIIDFHLVQVTEVTSSNAMEAEGCKRSLNFLIDQEIPVRCLSTDRHPTVSSNMKKLYPAIKHQFDTWHLAKSVVKKFTAKAKIKGCNDLHQWIQSVSNHLWWSASTCDGDTCLLKEKWISIVHHTANNHSWDGCSKFKKCEHHNLTTDEVRDTPWLKVGSLSHKALQDVVFDKRFLKDMEKMTEFHHIGQLEVFHFMTLKYIPKRQYISYKGIVERIQLAALDHNYNYNLMNRSQAVISNENGEVIKLFSQKVAKIGWQNQF